MGLHDFPESDWKIFRELQQLALERFCNRALEEVQTILRDGSRSHHERYLDVFRLLRRRDEELAHAFNDPRRSHMIVQLVAIYAYGLLEPHELGRFTARTHSTIESLAKEFTR
jgi:mannitol-1-phosphate/altronate dehydrogenase